MNARGPLLVPIQRTYVAGYGRDVSCRTKRPERVRTYRVEWKEMGGRVRGFGS